MRRLPHAPGFTLTADAFMGPDELVGFVLVHHPINIFSHFHDFFEVAFVLRGTGHHRSEAGVQVVGTGSVIFIAPGVSHGYELCDDLLVLNCFLRVEAARFDLSWALRDARLGRLFKPSGVTAVTPIVMTLDEAGLAECMTHLDAIRERPPAERGEAFDLGHFLLVLDLLARALERQRPQEVALRPSMPALVTSAVMVLERDLRVHWSLSALAQELSVDSFHLVRMFKRWLGLPPVAYANRRRAERAAVLLAATDDPVASIGVEVGWPDPAHFSRRFRQEFGASPRAFRARGRGSTALGVPQVVAGLPGDAAPIAADHGGARPEPPDAID